MSEVGTEVKKVQKKKRQTDGMRMKNSTMLRRLNKSVNGEDYPISADALEMLEMMMLNVNERIGKHCSSLMRLSRQHKKTLMCRHVEMAFRSIVSSQELFYGMKHAGDSAIADYADQHPPTA